MKSQAKSRLALLLAFSLVTVVPTPSFAKSACRELLARELKTIAGIKPEHSRSEKILRGIYVPLRTLYYPVFGPGNAVLKSIHLVRKEKSMRGLWKVPLQVLREDYLPLLAFLALIQSQDDKLVQSGTFHFASADFEDGESDELLIVAVVMSPNDPEHRFQSLLFKLEYAGFKHKRLIQAVSYADLLDQLQAISKEEGKIGRLDIVGHGWPGVLWIGESEVSSDEIDSHAPLRDVFEKDAKIRLSSCLTARGDAGDAFMDSIARSMLAQGGTVYASSVTFFEDDQPGYWLHLGNKTRRLLETAWLGPESLNMMLFHQEIPSPVPGEPKVKATHYAAAQ